MNGPIEFRFKDPDIQIKEFMDKDIFYILRVDIIKGFNNLTVIKVKGSLRIHGPLVKMHYYSTNAYIDKLSF